MRETAAQIELPSPPPEALTRWRVDADELILDIPPTGFSTDEYRVMLAVAAIVFCLGSVAFLCLAALLAGQAKVSLTVRLVFGIGFGVVCYAVPATVVLQGILWPAFRRTRVTASPEFLRVERRLGGFRRTTEISAGDLLELVPPALAPSGLSRPSGKGDSPAAARAAPRFFGAGAPAVVARGAKATIRFGQGLSLPELQWIHAAIAKAMAK